VRILMVLHAPPCSPALGPARRHLHLFEEISRRHPVSIITLAQPGDRERFEREHPGRYETAVFVSKRPRFLDLLIRFWYVLTLRCDFRRLYVRAVQRALDRALATERFDAVYFSCVMLGYYRLPTGLRSIGDAHNVEHDVLARAAAITDSLPLKLYYRMQARSTRHDEVRLARRFSEVWATSSRDAEQFIIARGDRRVAVVPNGIRVVPADPEAAHCDLADADRGLVLLFVGLMSYFPNSDAIEYFLDEIFPAVTARLPDARLRIVGADPPRRIRARAVHNVDVVGRVPDVAPYYRQASAFIVPLRCGGGTRVKVLEAMLHRAPVISTTLGCEGLQVRHDHSVLLADTPEAFADAVVRVCRDRTLARRIVAGGSDLVTTEYDWRQIGDTVGEILEDHHRPRDDARWAPGRSRPVCV
jgi:glycosyltransferase involved in cell wall biosynthesis